MQKLESVQGVVAAAAMVKKTGVVAVTAKRLINMNK